MASVLPLSSVLLSERESLMELFGLHGVRRVTVATGAIRLAEATLGAALMGVMRRRWCGAREMAAVGLTSSLAVARIAAMVGMAVAQELTAIAIGATDEASLEDDFFRRERRLRYKRWLCWTRFGMVVTVLQFLGAIYLMFIVLTDISYGGRSTSCFLGQDTVNQAWKKTLVVSFLLLVWLVILIQCFTGSDVLRWRSFYSTHDTAWKAHYREVFDHGIREALCCLGRVKYLSVLEEDEVYSVARLVGDLVAYRASGTGHLELLIGLALLQSHKQMQNLHDELLDAPDILVQKAAFFHQFAEAAYTGPLLDFGRNPILFPCAWLYRQGFLTPWARDRRPLLEGDNWWRGHAAAFLKFVNLPPKALRKGRVSQTKREAAYFVVVLHDKKTIVIAIRGTETPEDLITDGLCRECALTVEDLDGLINSEHLPSAKRQKVLSSFPHYGHAGIVESARELFMQIDGEHGDKDASPSEISGFLASLLGPGSECHGYEVNIVGHSLGGAIATLLGLRLYRWYPNLHVYAYGTLPCVDFVIAEACTDFVTTIVYNDEFSARLSVNSILRLHSAAINALSDDSLADSAIIQKFARRILHVNKYLEDGQNHNVSASSMRPSLAATEKNHVSKRRPFKPITVSAQMNQDLYLEDSSLFDDDASETQVLVDFDVWRANSCRTVSSKDTCLIMDRMTQFIGDQPSSTQVPVEPPEMFLPGCIVHIVREPKSILPFWKSWKLFEGDHNHRAFLPTRESFRDIKVTSHMFIDHLPWRCHYAIQRVLEERESQGRHRSNLLDAKDIANLDLLDLVS
ncbi:uncharacterized protein LOC135651774 isoform X2 [Musa acuminata AAA Group]|uniref:uncharacterized protein LOC135651774 isoform X2 n=1 Tax=Musa acuminata AAA Group TaxID=214697 RepID=UPI0031D64EB0